MDLAREADDWERILDAMGVARPQTGRFRQSGCPLFSVNACEEHACGFAEKQTENKINLLHVFCLTPQWSAFIFLWFLILQNKNDNQKGYMCICIYTFFTCEEVRLHVILYVKICGTSECVLFF